MVLTWIWKSQKPSTLTELMDLSWLLLLPPPREGGVRHFDPTQWTPFSIAVMQDCNVDAAIRFGHGRSLQFDSTFNCNTQKFPLYTLVVVDDHKKAVPIAFLICNQDRADLLQKFSEGRHFKGEYPNKQCILKQAPLALDTLVLQACVH